MVDIMNCTSEGHPDCRHISKKDIFWFCDRHKTTSIYPEVEGCHYYEAPGEYALKVALQESSDDFDKKILQYDIARHELLVESIRDGILYAVVAFTALALLVWWTA